ncbi:coiled-coil and C2 domain-containing protein 1-like isoform X2 [Aethina tumida]|uniref:coiled-coil and C2 domain-containing protein 1-like isoform X2 n=1 Tax=Aethina tumida TaxID=116153 RepID=UPI00214815C4|nr:coiled-coil and C2 domain-containing protein 1-like isoform X2 [Aethina tumida]
MFKKKQDKQKRNSGRDLSQFGLFNIPDLNNPMDNEDDDDGDSDLEAELAALSGGGGAKPKRPPRRKPISQGNLDSLVAESIKDIPSDEDVSDVDDNDPDLLNELQNIAGDELAPEESITESNPEPEPAKPTSDPSSDVLTLLESRLKMYTEAEVNAKAAGETSKVRRYGRAQKTLKDLIKQAKSGRAINNEDIPPEVHFVKRNPPPTDGEEATATPASSDPPASEAASADPPVPAITKEINTELLNLLNDRKMRYKMAALNSKKSGDTETAMKYIKIAKQFDTVIAAVEAGQPVDLSGMPGPPGDGIEQNQVQQNSSVDPPAEEDKPQEPVQAPALITASSVLEALEQRLAVFKEQENKAKQEDNPSKVRRYGRIIKQFEQAIKLHKAGKPIPVDELPTPPGYGPIPVGNGADAAPKSQPEPTPADTPPRPSKPSPPKTQTGGHTPTSRAEKQVVILLAKQKQFKMAALNAKRQGELVQAMEYLKTAKGFDRLLDAARAGLPVDWSSIPVSPEAKSQLDNEYDIVMADECNLDDSADADIMTRLENQLSKQLKMCLSTRDHHKALGDVAGMNRFERLAINVTKDLDVVRLAHRTPGAKVPLFHYEMKDFSIIKSFTELTDNDLELVILRGINYNAANPKDVDTYVKFIFPFPQDTPFSDYTSTVKDTNNPEYNSTFNIPIQRNSRNCQRVFKRHGIKFEVYSKGCASILCECFSGWFKSDSLMGTVNLKLQPLETQCEIHDSFDIMDGRKKTGGKLEVRLRLRSPIVAQEIEQLQEKWLIIDS